MKKSLLLFSAIMLSAGSLMAQSKANGEPRLLIKSAQSLMAPVWSPDGSKIAVTGDNFIGIWVANADGSNLNQVSEALGAGYKMNWQDAQTIVSTPYTMENGLRMVRIENVNVETAEISEVAPAQRGFRPSKVMKNVNLLRIMCDQPAEATRLIPSLEQYAGKMVLNPALSPDGKKIAFQIVSYGLFVCDVDGANLKSFGKGASLAAFLKQQDEMKVDTIALIRGGGNGIEALDDIAVLQTVSEMETPIICAIGHVGEELFLKSIADKVAPTPNGLGQYFSEMVERVAAKRNNSRAALVQEVKKQFQKQLEDSNKKNKELLDQIEKMTKQQQEQTKANKENIDKLNEQNKKNLEAQQKKNDEALAKFQAQSKQQMEQSQKQNAALQKQLADLSKSQKESLDKLTEQNKQTNTLLERERQHSRELERQLASKPNYTTTFIIIAIIATVVGFILAQIMK